MTAISHAQFVALCVHTMPKIAGACTTVSVQSPAAVALMAQYQRNPKVTSWAQFIETDMEPRIAHGLTTPLSSTTDAVRPSSGPSMTPVRANRPSAALESPGCPRVPSNRGLRPSGGVLAIPTPAQSPASSSTSSSSKRRTPRVQEKMHAAVLEGQAAANFRSLGTHGRRWLSAFISDRWDCHPGEHEYDRLAQRVKRSIKCHEVEAATGEALQKPGKRMILGGHRCRVVNPKERVRFASMTRQSNNTRMPELGYELYQWWVDLAQVRQARVPTTMIMAEANLMIEDAVRHANAAGTLGIAAPSFTLAKITAKWISRWRNFHSIVPRAITCSYKVSYAKKMVRLGVLWRNATRLLVFHEALFGPDKLTFVSMDEKPYRFNACGGDKVWATRGQKAVKCKELRAMLLSRWTGITAVFSRRHADACLPSGEWQPKWAALFRAKNGSRCEVTSPHSRCQVLFAEHGSVTTPTWKQYLRHVLPRVDNPEHAVVPVTDWYGPHLTEEAIDFAKVRTLSPTLFLGGGTTGEVAVCDKTPHRVLAQRYRELEMCAHTNALSHRPDKVPRWTKQMVLERGWQAWQELDHSCGDELHRTHRAHERRRGNARRWSRF